jgi:hypothetical protein
MNEEKIITPIICDSCDCHVFSSIHTLRVKDTDRDWEAAQ